MQIDSIVSVVLLFQCPMCVFVCFPVSTTFHYPFVQVLSPNPLLRAHLHCTFSSQKRC